MKMTHPDSKQTIDVDPARAEGYRTQGWVEAKAEPKADPKGK